MKRCHDVAVTNGPLDPGVEVPSPHMSIGMSSASASARMWPASWARVISLAHKLEQANLLRRRLHGVGAIAHDFVDRAVDGLKLSAAEEVALEGGPGVILCQGLVREFGKALEAALGERVDQVFLGGEVAVDRAHAKPSGARDVVHLRVEPIRGHELPRRLDHGLAVAPRVGALNAGEGSRQEWSLRVVRAEARNGTQVPYGRFRNRNSSSDYTR